VRTQKNQFGRFDREFRMFTEVWRSKLRYMRTQNLLTITAVSAGLALAGIVQANEGKHQEQSINSSEVPAAVQQAAKAEAKGANIVRWEKEGTNYEAVINENAKEIGIVINPTGKVLNRHDEAKEQKGKGSKY
jgi:hypothetical protein